MNLDDFYNYLDGDSEVTETVDEMFKRLRSYKVVKLDFYRRMMRDYKGWKPLTLEEYTLQLRGTQKQIIERELRKAREAVNKRVIRQNNLKK